MYWEYNNTNIYTFTNTVALKAPHLKKAMSIDSITLVDYSRGAEGLQGQTIFWHFILPSNTKISGPLNQGAE